MDAKTTKTPTGNLQQQQRPAGPGAAAAPGTRSRSAPARPGAAPAPGTPSSSAPARPAAPAAPGTRARPGPSAQPKNVAPGAPKDATSRTPTQPPPVPKNEAEKAAVQKRAEGRALVPVKFRDSFKRFFFTPTGMMKVIRLGLLIGALVSFIIAKAHEPYIAITVLEICIVLFFILIYMLTLHHLLINLDWSLLDLVNSFITAVFLLIIAILAMQEMERRHLFYVGGTQCLTAAIMCILDAIVVTKKMRDKMRRLLGLEYESSSSLLLEPKKTPEPGPTPAPGKAPTPAAEKAGTTAAGKAGMPGSSQPPTPGSSQPPTPVPSNVPAAAPAKTPAKAPPPTPATDARQASTQASPKPTTMPSSPPPSPPPSQT